MDGDFRADFVRQHGALRHHPALVLKDYVKPQKRAAFARFNLFLRDEFCFQYCGSRGDLTFDHVVPRASGGVTSWQNLCIVGSIFYSLLQWVSLDIYRLSAYYSRTVWAFMQSFSMFHWSADFPREVKV